MLTSNGVLLMNRQNKPIRWDSFSRNLDNKNGIIIGPSGSGKSVTMNAILTQEAESGAKLFIVDKSASYKKMIQIIGGSYYDFNMDNPIALNPFHLNPQLKPQKNAIIPHRKMQSLSRFILSMIKESSQSLHEIDKTIITLVEQTITELYLKKKTPILEEYYTILSQKEAPNVDVARLAANLKSYLDRKMFHDYFNNKETINIGEGEHIYIDLYGLDENKELQTLVAMNVIDMVLEHIELYRKYFKRYIFDEAWSIMKNKELGMIDLVIMLYRTVRKMNGGVWTISQSALDYEDPELQSAIGENVSTLIIMQQKEDTIRNTQKIFGFSDEEMMLIKTVKKTREYAEAYVRQEGKGAIVRVQLSPHELWAFTTDPGDNARLFERIRAIGGENGMNNRKAVLQAIQDLAEGGGA